MVLNLCNTRSYFKFFNENTEFKNFTFYNVDFDTSKDLLKTLKVSRQSAIIVFKQGKEQGRSLGDTKESSIKELLKKGS
jgi:thioredoxin 1